jgi:DNA-binding response OmpR family regulator
VKRVIIADDEHDYVLLMKRALSSDTQIDIVECFRGAEVFRRILSEPFDLAVLDYFLPDIKGDTICSELRSEEKNANLPILMVTGYHNVPEDVLVGYGASEVLYKPFSIEDFRSRVTRLLGL